jgi:hypothetical protein
MHMKKLLSVLLFLLPILINAQEEPKKVKFGKIEIEDFDLKSNLIDSGTNAVVISDIGNTDFRAEPNKKKFILEFKRERRIKLITKNGFDAATVVIPLYTQGSSTEKLDKLKAYTYNIENDKVVKTSLESSSVFTEQTTKNVVLKKFTFPGIKEGSIIEYSYMVSSDFIFNLQPWTFQSEYPCLWSEYSAGIPSFFTYLPMSQGYQEFYINKRDMSQVSYTFREESRIEPGSMGGRVPGENFELKGQINTFRWAMRDVPALKEESFTTTIENHIAKIEFQLMSTQYPDGPRKDYMNDWVQVSKDLLEDENFGRTFLRANNWLDDQIKPIIAGASTKVNVAQKIYAYIRDNFTVTRYGYTSSETNLKEVFTKKSGSVADINLLLIALLRHESIKAEPIILSTRSHGVIHPAYPLMDRFNYVICMAPIDSSSYFLDAAEPLLGFGRLPSRCYNGSAKLISSTPMDVEISPDAIKETKITSLFFVNGENGYSGSFSSELGYFESLRLRQSIKKLGKESFTKEISKSYSSDMSVKNVVLESFDAAEESLKISYDIDWKPEEDIIYLNPLFGEVTRQNPFKTAKREYPVEMSSAFDETIVVNMEIPKGYILDEAPKSARVKLNEDEGLFEYIIAANNTNIQLRCRLAIHKATFAKEDHETLRDFFSYVIKKQAEQIVLKKAK